MDDFRPRNKGQARPRFTDNRGFTPPPANSFRPTVSPPQPIPRQAQQHGAAGEQDELDQFFDRVFITQPPAPIARTPKPQKAKRKRRIPKKVYVIILVLLIGGAAGYWFALKPYLDKKNAPAASIQEQPPTEAPKQLSGNFRIIATGDFITHDSVVQNAKTATGYDFSPMMSEVKPILEKAQTRICHNTVPTASGVPAGYPDFNSPSELISNLGDSGCNVLSLASDHINDRSQAGVDETLAQVEKKKEIVISSGANKSAEQQAADRYFNVGDGAVKFAYFSYTTKSVKPPASPFGVNVYEKNKVAADIAKVREIADFILVSMCWGKEDSGDVQPDQDVVAQELANAGVDIVFGHCTHVVQPAKLMIPTSGNGQTVVYYSLGNAINSQLPIETLVGGFAVVDIDLATKKIVSTGFLPTYMHYEWTAAEKTAKTLNARKNLKLYPLDKADALMAASQSGTTVPAQTSRLQEILNRNTPIKLFTTDELLE